MKEPVYISVVLCTYNDERYIKSSVDSILNQTYPYFELIIVNDGSTDNTFTILKQIEDERIRIINKPNTGLADSLNEGVKAAKYQWIARMDGDDISLPNRLEVQIKLIDSGASVIGGQFYVIDENSKYKSKMPSNNPLSPLRSKLYVMLGWNPLAHPSALISKNALSMVGGYDPNFSASQDMDLWFRISKKHKIINTKEVVLLYRKHSNNISNGRKDIQIKMAFIAYIKRALGINRVLSPNEFRILQENQLISSLICKNHDYVKGLEGLKSIKRALVLVRYYAWRFWIFVRLSNTKITFE